MASDRVTCSKFGAPGAEGQDRAVQQCRFAVTGAPPAGQDPGRQFLRVLVLGLAPEKANVELQSELVNQYYFN